MSRMEGKSCSYDELVSLLAFYEKQSVEDSRELNNLRAKTKRMVEAGNRLAATSDSGVEIANWWSAISDNSKERELSERE